MKFLLKTKFLIGMTALIVLTGIITTVIGTYLINRGVINQVQDRVHNDLNYAREILNNRIREIERTLYFSSIRDNMRGALMRRDRNALERYLNQARRIIGVEMATILDNTGTVVCRAANPGFYGDDMSGDPLIRKVLKFKKPVSSAVLVPAAELGKEGRIFADRAHIKIISTPLAKKPGRTEETSGMMLKAAVPLLDADDAVIGIIYGGDLLNRDYRLVDKIKSILYHGETYGGKDIGTATIFQDDLRISTNVMTASGKRAIGTRVSEVVHDEVLGRGRSWSDRAFVVNAWYITAYEPVRDIDGRIIGMLYVGLLEKKFFDLRTDALLVFFSVTLIGIIAVLSALRFLAERIIRRIERLVRITRRIARGDFSVRVGTGATDEIGDLQNSINAMTTALRERDEELRQRAEIQLMRTQKLAAMGRMAAGIAHEINNPLTGILMYSHLLLKKMPEGSQEKDDVEIVIYETTRCRDIIRDLLDFSREKDPEKQLIDVHEPVRKALSIIVKQVMCEKIEFVEDFSAAPGTILGDANKLEQVFINLLLNAIEAMPDGGRILIETRTTGDGGNVVLKISDTGAGIPAENLDKIFDPFFTTKEVGQGTGLGLAVTYGIIKQHDARIAVESEPGRGTAVTIEFPAGDRAG